MVTLLVGRDKSSVHNDTLCVNSEFIVGFGNLAGLDPPSNVLLSCLAACLEPPRNACLVILTHVSCHLDRQRVSCHLVMLAMRVLSCLSQCVSCHACRSQCVSCHALSCLSQCVSCHACRHACHALSCSMRVLSCSEQCCLSCHALSCSMRVLSCSSCHALLNACLVMLRAMLLVLSCLSCFVMLNACLVMLRAMSCCHVLLRV